MVQFRVVRKIVLSLIFLCCSSVAWADSCVLPEENPFFGKYKNQISFSIGQGFDTGILLPPPVRPVPFYIATFQYSQPTTFFRVPAKRSINLSGVFGLHAKNGWEWQDYSVPIIYFTEDIALFKLDKFFIGTGAGAGLQAKENDRLGTKLLFQFKVTAGYSFNKKWAMEIYAQHFSNANTDHNNYSYAFYGLGVTYNY
ncbi:MAG: acyloxyacyl hydrolase [Alphaproteobacteria bacterium]|nr:acyloxyacyl hydrolase [Alphaproteobacteria bacterium]